jgi:GNAT superfamily N-acetyltransferase
MQPQNWGIVEAWWAQVFGCAEAVLWQGLSVAFHTGLGDYEGIYVAHRAAGCHVSLPHYLDSETCESLSQQGHSRLRDPGFWQRLPETAHLSVLGPSVHSYTDRAPSPGHQGAASGHEVVEARTDELESLRPFVDPAEWDEGGFSDETSALFVIRDGPGDVVAAANLTDFLDGPSDVGVLVHPGFRSMGLGRAVAAGATSYAVKHHGIARWRARVANTPSRKVAAALGFEDYCHQMAIR